MIRLGTFLLAAVAAVFAAYPSYACSSVVISGKVTPDGRPLLWKHRDSDYLQNSVKFFKGEKYSFIAIVNSVEDNPTDVWMGVNSAGFAIMNTQSFNLVDVAPGEERGAANGRIMRRALEICATVEDFHHFLDTLAKPSMIEASLGVIDAQGGAQMLEVDYYKYVVYDANDPAVAPHGYVARTNFSFTGDVNEGLGQVRYLIEEGLLMPGSGMGLFTPQWILTDVARCFENPIMGIDLRSGDFNKPKTNGWFIDYDFISRRGSTSSAVVQGVRPGENPELTVMWTILGYPPTGVAMPLWVKGADKYLPALVARDEATKFSPLCDFSQTLADQVYSYHQGDGTDRYMNWELLWRPSGGGYMQQLLEVEDQVFDVSEPVIDGWREAGRIDVGQMSELYLMLDGLIRDGYRPLLGTHPLL